MPRTGGRCWGPPAPRKRPGWGAARGRMRGRISPRVGRSPAAGGGSRGERGFSSAVAAERGRRWPRRCPAGSRAPSPSRVGGTGAPRGRGRSGQGRIRPNSPGVPCRPRRAEPLVSPRPPGEAPLLGRSDRRSRSWPQPPGHMPPPPPRAAPRPRRGSPRAVSRVGRARLQAASAAAGRWDADRELRGWAGPGRGENVVRWAGQPRAAGASRQSWRRPAAVRK